MTHFFVVFHLNPKGKIRCNKKLQTSILFHKSGSPLISFLPATSEPSILKLPFYPHPKEKNKDKKAYTTTTATSTTTTRITFV